MKVLIADDVPIIRQGLRAILEKESSIQVVGTAKDGRDAYEKAKILKPDLILMDMRMPEFDGAFGIKQIKTEFPEIKVLVLTTFDDDETVQKAISSGADGYLLKEMEDDKIIASILNVNMGISVFQSSVFSSIKEQIEWTPLDSKENLDNAEEDCFYSMKSRQSIHFTEKERQILKLIADGYDNKEIASKLFIAEGTARNSISKLLDKVEVKDRTMLAVYAVKNGLDV